MRFLLSETEAHCIRQLTSIDGKVWAVGGCIRDSLLGLVPHDIDLVTDLPPGLSSGILTKGGLTLIPDRTAFEHGIVRVASQEGPIDIASLRKDIATDGRHARIEFTSSIEDDLARRDLTCNAIAARIDETGTLGELIDPHGGEVDIRHGKIRFVGDAATRIKEDALRMLRACRFVALGEQFWIPIDQQEAIVAHADNIDLVSVERVRDEIMKAMGYARPDKFILALQRMGLLEQILVPIHRCIDVDQSLHHAEPVYDHLVYTCKAMSVLSTDPLLRLAALFHDVGKPQTRGKGKDGQIHFYKHEIEGARIAYDWMKTYKFSQKDCERVIALVRHHMFHFEDDTKDKTIRKWLREVGPAWKDLILLRSADRRGNLAKLNKPMITQKMQYIIDKAQELIKSGQPIFDGDLAIDGNDLKALGIKPGPIYKDIFQKIWALVLNEPERNTKEFLTEFVQKRCLNAAEGRPDSTSVGRGTQEGGTGDAIIDSVAATNTD